MRMRAKALTVAAAMVTTFSILPTLGAAAAEPLEDGAYDVTVGESTWTVEVVDGAPAVDSAEGTEFIFEYSDEGVVLDEFDLTVDGLTYDVAVADDGTVQVTAREVDEGAGEETPDDDGESTVDGDGDGDATADGEGDGEPTVDGDGEGDQDGDATVEGEGDEEVGSELDATDEGDEAADDAHGELVSAVARCAPSGRAAREAGLPNHGFFVRAAAHGERVEFEVDGETHAADLTTPEGAEAFCALAAELTDAAAGTEEEVTEPAGTEEDVVAPGDAALEADDDEPSGKGRSSTARGRSGDAPGRSGDAPGRSGEAPGRAKKGR